MVCQEFSFEIQFEAGIEVNPCCSGFRRRFRLEGGRQTDSTVYYVVRQHFSKFKTGHFYVGEITFQLK